MPADVKKDDLAFRYFPDSYRWSMGLSDLSLRSALARH